MFYTEKRNLHWKIKRGNRQVMFLQSSKQKKFERGAYLNGGLINLKELIMAQNS